MIIKNLLKEKIFTYLIGFNLILLLYKSKFVLTLFWNLFQGSYLFLFHISHFIKWDFYGICLAQITQKDLITIYNIFGANILLLNIFFLCYMNKNSFQFTFKFSKNILVESFKKDFFYFITLSIVTLITLHQVFLFPGGDIMNIDYLYTPCGIPFKNFLLDPYYVRYFILCIYKLLSLYVSFGSENTSLIYRLLTWMVLMIIIKVASMNSAFIVDAGLCFLAAHPDLGNFNNFTLKIYFDSFFAYCMEGRKENESQKRDYKLTNWSSTWMHFWESQEDFEKRISICRHHRSDALACEQIKKNLAACIAAYACPETLGKVAETDMQAARGKCLSEHTAKYRNCMNDTSWKDQSNK